MTEPNPSKPYPILDSLPLFPLGTVLFPGGLLPLRIFEVRYLDMISRCHKAGVPFGVVALTQGSEVRVAGAATERFSGFGTLAKITSFQTPQPGLLQIECIGTQRFKVRTSELHKHGLWTAEVERIEDDMALRLPEDLQYVSNALRRLIETLEKRQAVQPDEDMQLPIAKPYRFNDSGWVANRWSELLPVSPEQKQRLMELDSPLMRLELVSDLLSHTGIAE